MRLTEDELAEIEARLQKWTPHPDAPRLIAEVRALRAELEARDRRIANAIDVAECASCASPDAWWMVDCLTENDEAREEKP